MNKAYRKFLKLLRDPERFVRDSPLLKPWAPERAARLQDLLRPGAAQDLLRQTEGQPLHYAYLPWIGGHTNALMAKVSRTVPGVWPVELFEHADDSAAARGQLIRLARERPAEFRRLCLSIFGALQARLRGVLFTLDWTPAMRHAALACRELGIPTILIPHESVFRDRNLYYTDLNTGANVPVCDAVLAWGELQRSIFVERGYPAERLIVVGAPKFDSYVPYRPSMSREAFCRVYGLNPGQPIITLATQPFDSHDDRALSQTVQQRMVRDLRTLAKAHNWQVLVRLPPNRDPVLTAEQIETYERAPHFACDLAPYYLTSPEETLFHSAVVCSANSTMLLEAAVLGRPSVAITYGAFDTIWGAYGCPVADSGESLERLLVEHVDAQRTSFDEEGLRHASRDFSVGCFDGKAAERIHSQLESWTSQPLTPYSVESVLLTPTRHAATQRLPFRVGGYTELTPAMRYLPDMLGAKEFRVLPEAPRAAQCDLFIIWGGKSSMARNSLMTVARRIGRPVFFVEDGLIRSLELGLRDSPGLSIMLDALGLPIDCSRPSQLERTLNSDFSLNQEERQRAERGIAAIVTKRLSKYNHAPDHVALPPASKPYVLVVDQRFEDQSVILGGASAATFEEMLVAAVTENPDRTVVVKQHPDHTSGFKESYYPEAKVQQVIDRLGLAPDRIRLLADECNPHALLDICDKVYVVASTLGLEALLREKEVHCFGLPFYAGWGPTRDRQRCTRRTATRTTLELFHAIYLQHSLYYSPDCGPCDLEQTLDYITSRQQASPTLSNDLRPGAPEGETQPGSGG